MGLPWVQIQPPRGFCDHVSNFASWMARDRPHILIFRICGDHNGLLVLDELYHLLMHRDVLLHLVGISENWSLYLCKRGFYFYKRVFEKLCLFNITCQRPCCLHLCCLKVCVSWKASSQRTCAVIAIFLESIPCENMLTWPIFFEHCLLENIISVFSKHRKYVPACIQINLMTFCFFPKRICSD